MLMSENEGEAILRVFLSRTKFYFWIRIINFKSPGSPSTCGSPSERNGISNPLVTPGSTSTSNTFSSVTNLQWETKTFRNKRKHFWIYFIFGHSSQTCSWTIWNYEEKKNRFLLQSNVNLLVLFQVRLVSYAFPFDSCIFSSHLFA